MSSVVDGSSLLRALDQRLSAVATALAVRSVDASTLDGPDARIGALLPVLIAACRRAPRNDVLWLVMTAVFGALPRPEEVHSFRRQLDVQEDREICAGLLAAVISRPGRGALDLELDVHSGGVVVNVDFSARHDLHTGIHRVVRETLPRWQAAHTIIPTANVDDYSGLRTLTAREWGRVFAFGTDGSTPTPHAVGRRPRLVVPWRGVLVIPEIPDPAFGPCLAALAEHSGNAVSVIGYDMIPVVSADLRPPVDAVRFAKYLTVVKHAHRVAGISVAATSAFTGFADAVHAQGLPGPEVLEVPLPAEVPPSPGTPQRVDPNRPPRVLCVGSHEPHKNQQTVLHAAERLWRSGLSFELHFIGGPGWQSEDFLQRVADTRARGRAVQDHGRVTDDELWCAYRDASFTVFISLHEGYGLPVAESLACGTPVVTANYGSLGEIARAGGCLTVDPRDDDAVTDALRRLLTEPATLQNLQEEARRRPVRRWDEYASELWDVLARAEPST